MLVLTTKLQPEVVIYNHDCLIRCDIFFFFSKCVGLILNLPMFSPQGIKELQIPLLLIHTVFVLYPLLVTLHVAEWYPVCLCY